MKPILLAVLAAIGLSGCAEGYYGPYGGGGLAYYDDFYGPYYDGYWGSDGYFWYRPDRGHGFVRDENRHFRRENGGAGFHGVHAHSGFHGSHGGAHASDGQHRP